MRGAGGQTCPRCPFVAASRATGSTPSSPRGMSMHATAARAPHGETAGRHPAAGIGSVSPCARHLRRGRSRRTQRGEGVAGQDAERPGRRSPCWAGLLAHTAGTGPRALFDLSCLGSKSRGPSPHSYRQFVGVECPRTPARITQEFCAWVRVPSRGWPRRELDGRHREAARGIQEGGGRGEEGPGRGGAGRV
jgi:hypothetical protein